MASNLLHDLIKIKYINEGYLPNTPYHQISDNEMIRAFLSTEDESGFPVTEYDEEYPVFITPRNFDKLGLNGYFIDTYPCPSRDDEDIFQSYIDLLNSIIYATYNYKTGGVGDVNQDGVLNYTDIMLIRRVVAGLDVFTPEEWAIADVDGDGDVTMKDVLILRKLIKFGHVDSGDKHYDVTDIILPNWVYPYMFGNAVGQYSSIPDKHDLLVMLGTDNTYDEYDEKSAKACLATSREYLNRIGNNLRAPTMFGEPHVIKALRLKESNL